MRVHVISKYMETGNICILKYFCLSLLCITHKDMEDIKEKAGLFLKDYCNFTQADIDSLENRDRTSVIALLTRRMFDEE